MSEPVRTKYTALGAALLTACFPLLAHGEEEPQERAGKSAPSQRQATPDPEVDEIIVTARLRAESAFDVPITETVFTAAQIEDARIDQVDGFIGLTPNVTIVRTQNSGTNFVTVRGITQVRNGEPPIATVVDGVLLTSPNQFTQDLFDVQSIEILKGPQGALYGRNATGGAIIITTREPSNERRGHLRVGTGRGDEYLVQGALSGPIVADKLLFRAAVRYRDFGGTLQNLVLNEPVDYSEDLTVRGKLFWNMSERLRGDLRVSVNRTDGGALNHHFQPALLAPDGVTLDPNNPFPFDFSIADADLVDRNFRANNLGKNDRDIDEYTLKFDYDAGWGTFTSITAYNRVEEYIEGDQFPYTKSLTRDFGGGFVVDGTQTQFLDVTTRSQELRLTSRGDRRFRWQIGAYYLETERFISTTTGDDLGQGIVRIERAPLFSDPRNPTLSFFADDNDNQAWATFGNIAYDLTDKWEFALAGRYDKDEREQFVSPLSTGGVPGSVNRAEFDKFQPKVTLRYRASDRLSVFGSWGQGFRSGQFNQNGVGAAAAAAGIPGVQDVVDEEITTTWELGFKSQSAGGRFSLNGAVYQTDLEGQQYFVFIGAVGAQVLVGIDEVDLLGGELEATLRLAPGLDAYASVGVTDGEIEKYAVNPAAVGNESPYVPDYTFNTGLQYRRPVSTQLGGLLRIDFERRGRQFWDPENTTARSALDLINLRVGIEDRDERWSLTGTVENLTDEVYNSEWVLGGFPHTAQPRLWHLDFRMNF